jgi:hypothetical protein
LAENGEIAALDFRPQQFTLLIWYLKEKEVGFMVAEYVNEMFRSESSEFYKNFGDYLVNKRGDDWNVKNCTFFQDDDEKRMWAWCLFEKKA